MTRKRQKTRTRQQRRAIRRRTEKRPFGCAQCGYWSVCWDGLCLRCLDHGFTGPNEKALQYFQRLATNHLASLLRVRSSL